MFNINNKIILLRSLNMTLTPQIARNFIDSYKPAYHIYSIKKCDITKTIWKAY